MSVAFRRDSDEEHLEPKFELPIPAGPNLVTPRGLTLIGERIVALESAIEAEPDDTRKAALKRDLRYWKIRQTTAQLAPPAATDTVSFGSRVRFELNGAERSIDIVGDDEAEPAAGRIAFSAPLARALIGGAEGDLLDFGGKEEAIEILAVGPIPD